MSEESSSPIIESNRDKQKKGLPIGAIAVAAILVCIAAGIAVVFLGRACSAEQHKQFATGSEYTVTGYILEAKSEVVHDGPNRNDKHTVYTVRLQLDSPLPNGDKTYTSNESSEFNAVSRFSSNPKAWMEFTFSKDGYLEKALPIKEDGSYVDFTNSDEVEKYLFSNLSQDALDSWSSRLESLSSRISTSSSSASSSSRNRTEQLLNQLQSDKE